MSTTQESRSKKKPPKKQRRRLQLRRSKHRSTKTKQKSIGLKSTRAILTETDTATTTTNGIDHDNDNDNNNNKGIKIADKLFVSSASRSTSSTITSSSLSSTSSSISSLSKNKKVHHHKLQRKNRKLQLGVNKDQLKRQKNARRDKKKKKTHFAKLKKLKTDRINNHRSISKQDFYEMDMNKDDDILPMMRENINIDSSIHIIRNLGKHEIYIHNKEKDNKDIGLLRINANIEQFKYLKVNDILEILYNEITLTLKISKIESSGARNWSLSIDSQIASQWNLSKGLISRINLINPLSLELLQIEITFKNQYISRGKQWKIQQDLVNRIVHINENIKNSIKGYNINIKCCKSLTQNGKIVSCGLITKKTKFLFRSNSSWFIYLIQLSKEMWDFSGNSDNGKQIHFEKFIDGFLKTVMMKWKKNQCQHVYSIIFFSRTFYENDHVNNISPSNYNRNNNNSFTYNVTSTQRKKHTKVFNQDSDNRYYQDHYMVVVRNWTGNDWNELSKKLRKAFDIFPRRVKWKKIKNNNNDNISVASEGNLLEAIQLSLNVLDKHYIDRDLRRTGMSITVVTAGNGLYFVNKSLANFTKVRILNNGINCDIVSMSKPPIHPTPLFVYGSPLAFGMSHISYIYIYIHIINCIYLFYYLLFIVKDSGK